MKQVNRCARLTKFKLTTLTFSYIIKLVNKGAYMVKERSVIALELKRPLEMSEIKNIAIVVREQFENQRINMRLLRELYHRYNPEVEDIDSFVRHAGNLFPKLNCGLATVYLRHKLGVGNIVNGKYRDEDHTFLLLGNNNEKGIVADITADQYGGPDIYVGPLQSPWGFKPKK